MKLEQYYAPETLQSEFARRTFVLPDALAPGPHGAWDDLATWTGSVGRGPMSAVPGRAGELPGAHLAVHRIGHDRGEAVPARRGGRRLAVLTPPPLQTRRKKSANKVFARIVLCYWRDARRPTPAR